MSASTEKKLRQAAREAGTDKKTLALEKEAKEKAKQEAAEEYPDMIDWDELPQL